MSALEHQIRIANVRTLNLLPGETAVYVGRGRVPDGMEAGDLGNPFRVGPAFRQGEAAAAFLPYLRDAYRRRGLIRRQIRQLAARLLAGERLVLTCWCFPRACHAVHIRAAVLGVACQMQASPAA